MSNSTILRPVRTADAAAVWAMLEPATAELVGMTSLPANADAARTMCAASAATVTDLAAGAFELADGGAASVMFVLVDSLSDEAPADEAPAIVGVTGLTFKQAVPNLAVQVVTSGDGLGLDMLSSSVPWTRTELNSSYLAPSSRGRGFGALLSRGRLMFIHQVQRQVPSTIASHVRGRFDDDGSAPFWDCFGGQFATAWPDSEAAESALADDPDRLSDLADLRLPVTAPVLDSLGPVNRASLPAFRLLMQEGLRPNGMYDPIDGGPTLVAERSETMTSRNRHHGRASVTDELSRSAPGMERGLVAVTSVDNFRAAHVPIAAAEEGAADGRAAADTIEITPSTAASLGVESGALLAASPLIPSDAPAELRERATP